MNEYTHLRKTIITGIVGNLMEWYDFAVYGFMVPIIGNLFFPSNNPVATIIATFSAFAAGYLSRPLGGIVFGHIGDHYGRKAVLNLSVILMGLSTCAIGLLPTTAQVGVTAAVLLVILRILQGMSVGGEYTGSITFVLEHSKPHRRGFSTSWIAVGGTLGFLVGSAVSTVIQATFTPEQLSNWAWRLPFLSGIIIAGVGYLIRRNTKEPPRPDDIPRPSFPIGIALREHWRPMLQLMGLALAVNAGFYLMFIYASTYLTEHMHAATTPVMEINTLNLVLMALIIPLSGFASDRWGRKPLLIIGNLGFLLLSYPLFWIMHQANIPSVFIGQFGFAALVGIVWGVNPVTLGEILPMKVRVSAFSMAYNVCMALFGGTTPLVAAYLLQRTDNDFAPVWYLVGLSLISLITVFTISETRPPRNRSKRWS